MKASTVYESTYIFLASLTIDFNASVRQAFLIHKV